MCVQGDPIRDSTHLLQPLWMLHRGSCLREHFLSYYTHITHLALPLNCEFLNGRDQPLIHTYSYPQYFAQCLEKEKTQQMFLYGKAQIDG